MAESEKNDVTALEHQPCVRDVESCDNASESSLPDPAYRHINSKIDRHVLPALSVLYLLAFLDRLNIGSALVFYLPEDLKLKNDQLNIALAIFFPAYIVFNIPANILIKKIRPHVFSMSTLIYNAKIYAESSPQVVGIESLNRITVTISLFVFGLITVLQGLVQNFAGLAAVRVFLGLSEAGFFSGCYYIIGMWYPRTAALRRYTVLFVMSSVSSSIGGLLASAIGNMDGIRGYRAWRWIFILEGCFTCAISFLSYYTVTDFPEDAKWLSEEERVYIRRRLKADQGSSEAEKGIPFREAVRAFKDYKIFLGTFLYFSILMPSYGLAYFIPTIVATYGYSPIQAQLHSIPIYVVSAAVSFLVSILSDRSAHRFLFVLFGFAVAIVGCAILFTVHSNRTLEYVALFIFASGLSIDIPIVICWATMNLPGHRRRSVGGAFMFGVGESGGILATFAFLATDAPEYRLGYSLSLGFLAAGTLTAVAYYAACRWQNRALRADEEKESERAEVSSRAKGTMEEGEVESLRARVEKREIDWGYRYFL